MTAPSKDDLDRIWLRPPTPLEVVDAEPVMSDDWADDWRQVLLFFAGSTALGFAVGVALTHLL